ncbi:MAG: ABC transporter ATP-binding protein [Chloroflexi bacterium]|nr:ABC transporter ATP-binding protein [Chloroflexota bacterium]
MGDSVLRLELVSKLFGAVRAVDRIELVVERGHVFTLLGPSGCGKTTTLRMVAGLERPDEGRIVFAGRPVADAARGLFVPSHKRHMGMVFQSYAIWPHMTVYANVAYPLEVRGVPKKTIRAKVDQVLDLVGMTGFADRPAPLLSGGQQQRVALCRALVYEPDLLLLDEPFSNLDAKLRHHMRVEVKLLQQRLGITVLFVTHDQVEALSMSDRIGVMNQGQLEQVGSPSELYDTPASRFVRDFLGQTVNLRGQVVRPEDVVVSQRNGSTGDAPNTVAGVIEALLFVGDSYEARIALEHGQPVLLALPRSGGWAPGQAVVLSWLPERTHAWPA